ncbi:hypothetical protein DSL72_006299 [Monilinia vaccinii-corymbosi]|uniref:Uncharacterized protein n=1 Tax=Monilinia vaccinii-corymbosi TaxID=61207 RepID=A0A8A3PLV4_9HELO|nr:hypothetical protein DSL72_006299 [Monilinia vaccinii-corymbosi]
MTNDLPPNPAWAAHAVKPAKKPTPTISARGSASSFVPTPKTNPPPPVVTLPKRNEGMEAPGGLASLPPNSSSGSSGSSGPGIPPPPHPPTRNDGRASDTLGGLASHQPTSSSSSFSAPEPALPPPYSPPPPVVPPTRNDVVPPISNNGKASDTLSGLVSHQPTTSSSSAPEPALPPLYFPPPPSTPAVAGPEPIVFLPHRPLAPIPDDPPAPQVLFDAVYQRYTEEMDWWSDEYSRYINSFDEMAWDWTEDYLNDLCDIIF